MKISNMIINRKLKNYKILNEYPEVYTKLYRIFIGQT
jgi:hypothetical protein